MLPSSNGIAWLEGEEDEGISWAVRNNSEGDICKNLGMNASSLTSFSSLFNVPFDNSFNLDCESNFLTNSNSPVLPNPELSFGSNFAATRFLPIYDNNNNNSIGGGFSPIGYDGFQGSSGSALFSNKTKILRPLEVLPPVEAQSALFQKRAALRQGSGEADKLS